MDDLVVLCCECGKLEVIPKASIPVPDGTGHHAYPGEDRNYICYAVPMPIASPELIQSFTENGPRALEVV